MLAPIYILTISLMLSNAPYIWWVFEGENQSYNYSITGLPIAVWAIAFFSCYMGTAVLHRAPVAYRKPFRIRYFIYLAYIIGLLSILTNLLVIAHYGGIPIILISSNISDIHDMNVDQSTAVPGLFGINLIMNTSAVFMIAISRNAQNIGVLVLKRHVTMLLSISLFLAIISTAKRQFLIEAIVLYFSISVLIQGAKNKSVIKKNLKYISIGVVSVLIFTAVFGFIGNLRSIDGVGSGFEQIKLYLEYPLINLEWQLANYGYIVPELKIEPIIFNFVPYKFFAGSATGRDVTELVYGFLYPEPGIGAGMFGPLILAFGLWGVIFFSFGIGWFCQEIYSRSLVDYRYIVPYATCVWPLVSGHSYNHFLSPIFFWIPFMSAIGISRIIWR